MAEISFACPGCGRNYQVQADLAGKKARCKECDSVMRIPAAQTENTSATRGESELNFPCPRCGYGFRLAANLAGKKARCKQCGEVFRVPERRTGERAQAEHDEPWCAVEEEESAYSLVEDEPPLPVTAGAGSEEIPGPTAASRRESQPEDRQPDASTPAPALKNWLVYRVKMVAVAGLLILLGWTFSSLFPRAWKAGVQLVGTSSESPNDPAAHSAGDPELDAPDIAPDRLTLVEQHQEAIVEMAQAFMAMAQGYKGMRNPQTFERAKQEVGEASAKLDAAAQKGASLPKLEPAEKAALTYVVNTELKKNADMAARELNILMRTDGIQGNFDKLMAGINQARQQFDREWGNDMSRPSVLLIMKEISDQAQQQLILKKATALVDYSHSGGSSWGTENKTSRLKLTPVYSARAYADKINFGTVRSVKGRRIELDVAPPTAEEIAQVQARMPASQPQPAAPEKPASAPAPASTAPVTTPSIVSFLWLDESRDFVGGHKENEDPGHADGTKDQHFLAVIDFPPRSSLEELTISASNGRRWMMRPDPTHWPIAVHQGDNVLVVSHTNGRVDEFSGRQSFDLFGNTYSDIRPGMSFDLQAVVLLNGTRQTLTAHCQRP